MIVSQKYIYVFLVIQLIIFDVTSARQRRKACDESKNEVFSSCGNPCKQFTCYDRDHNITTKSCTTECKSGCICKYGCVRHIEITDACVIDC